MKKIVLLSLAILLIFATACGAAEQNEIVPEYEVSGDGEGYDFGGATFRVIGWGDTSFFPIMGETDTGDKQLARYAALRSECNCNFEALLNYCSDAYSASVFIRNYSAGMPLPDLIYREAQCMYDMYKMNFLASLDSISTIDSRDYEKYGPLYMRAQSMFDGTPYGFIAYQWNDSPALHGMVQFNNQLIAKFGMTSPYELLENGEWTFDNFKKELELGTKTEGDNSYVGMMVETAGHMHIDMVQCACFANGAQMIIEQNGKNVFGFNSPQAVYALEYCASLYKDGVLKIGNTNNFINEECVYMFSRYVDPAANYLEDFGYLNFPYGPSSNGRTSAYVAYDIIEYVCKMTDNEIEDIGRVIDFLYEPLDDQGGWKEKLRLYYHHEEDIAAVLDGVENANYNYEVQLEGLYDTYRDAAEKAFYGYSTANEAMASVTEAINIQIQDADIQLIDPSVIS